MKQSIAKQAGCISEHILSIENGIQTIGLVLTKVNIDLINLKNSFMSALLHFTCF